MDLLELRRLYMQAADQANKAHNHRDEALLAEDEAIRDMENSYYEQSLIRLERIELKIQAIKLSIPTA